jgi:hypothetical protein
MECLVLLEGQERRYAESSYLLVSCHDVSDIQSLATATAAILWWESPWILFPEGWYIIVLLNSLLLLQEPVLAVMTLYPSLGTSTRLHVAADATIGIGVQGVMFVYLCLF